jgi:ParB-like chromosome segregation protein Spo0J
MKKIKNLTQKLKDKINSLDKETRIEALNHVNKQVNSLANGISYPVNLPCLKTVLVPSNKVRANDYNPNKVANKEMELLQHSIEEDGFTEAIVTFYDKEQNMYEVVDGFHRYVILKDELNCNYIPVVVIEKDIKERMASTIRHNRARGVHQVDLMGELVVKLVKLGWNDDRIAEHLGMEYEEVLRLKQTTGIAEVFKDRKHSKSWVIKGDE